jgi:predicted CXXCH cytochrome family protein
MSRLVPRLVSAATLATWVLAASLAHGAVATTKHNLSASGTGTLKATSETEICLFCHAPHNSAPAGQLWNRRTSAASYTPYTSSTLKSLPGQPNGASLLCLSCHDGTIALGEVLNRTTPIGMAGGPLAGNALLGTNLSDDHPISFTYDVALRAARGELADPTTLVKPNPVRLDSTGRLQCTACHDPHDNTNGKFLVTSNSWAASDHRTSTRTWNGIAPNPWPHTSLTTVAANACEGCHRPHTAGGGKRLLNYAAEEANCFACHNANVATKNIQAEFNKASTHRVASYLGTHDPAETSPVATRHVECVDCHNPHAANTTAGSAPGSSAPVLSGSLAGMSGINIGGIAVKPATYEYEICFRCHADGTANVPTPRTTRQYSQNNKRMDFQTTNPSFHPLAGAGRSTNVPSLIGPTWTTSSRVLCTDCHNNNAAPSAGGTGPNGPHGSTNALLLKRQYVVTDNTAESAANYALCYECHNRTSILGNATFKEHNKHVVGERAPCNVCHDPHGISATQGNVTNNSRLINFDTTIVTASGGALRWETRGTNTGACYLTCHGANHNGWTY